MVREDVRIRKPLVIVLTLATLVSIYQYLLASKLSQALPSELAKFFTIGVYIAIVSSFIGMFAAWLLIAAMMHAVSALFDGKGPFRRTFEFTGYGFLPSLVGSFITIPMSTYYVMNAEIPKISIEQLRHNPGIMKSLILSIIPQDLIYSNLLINLAVTVWSLTLWTFAIKHARNLTTKKAFISALIPAVVFGLYQIYSITRLL